jgi:DNA mismatch repair protein MutS2
MFQCGFLVPASENSEMPIFNSLFINIGDEQSIESDLSTYSSHLLNIKKILREADGRSMVFIDEFGSGTEPVIGGAIAEAVLEVLVEKGCYGVITTHYANIKYFASTHAGVVNGAMMFDVEQIRPLFKLESGTPGSSFAIEIARKIGLPEEIIRSASEKAGSDHINIEKQLRDIARDKRYWETKREKIRVTDKRVAELEQEYAEQLAKLKAERSQIIRGAKSEAKTLVAEANRQIENTIRIIRESQADKELTRLARKELDLARDKTLDEATGEADVERDLQIDREMERVARRIERRKERRNNPSEKAVAKPIVERRKVIAVGSKVRLKGGDTGGEVIEISGTKASVAFGQILSWVAVERLEPISEGEYKNTTRPSKPRAIVSGDISERKLNFAPRIDVRGMRPTEAIEAVEVFIDDALMVGVNNVTILHGKGTGALKEEIRRYLKGIPAVESATDDHADRGGAGITVVTFKN